MKAKVLIADDDELMRAFMVTVLSEEGYLISEAEDGQKALRLIEDEDFEVVISDIKMPHLSGTELMQRAQQIRGGMKWIFLTAYGSIPEAVKAVREGAIDYLSKPLKDPDELRQVVKRAIRELEQDRKIELLSEQISKGIPPLDIIFCGSKMQTILNLVKEVAPTQATVLITGPSGTGKELVARVIHELSPRRGHPFVPIHCAALSESVLESELFGHEKGAFTGALALRKGRFESAKGGTVFLDEIGEISKTVQVKLLRVLQEKTIERVGGSTPIPVDIRILAATNRDLGIEITEGRFREDLYYRLNVFPLKLPPLAERLDAIETLTEYLVNKHAMLLGKKGISLADESIEMLKAYHWPGNIRELQNVLERAVILSKGRIEPHHLNLPSTVKRAETGQGKLDDIEREAILHALQQSGGNKKKAAELLGISRRTLHYKLRDYEAMGWRPDS